MDTSGITFRHRSACRTPAESRKEYLTSGKEYIDPRKLGRMKELGEKQEKTKKPWQVGELKPVSDPHIRAIV